MRTLSILLFALTALACRNKDAPIPDTALVYDVEDTAIDTGDRGLANDADGDGWPNSGSAGGADCDDSDPEVHPGADELCDGIDNDCDGETDEDDAIDAATWYADTDADGYGDAATAACEQPDGHVEIDGDCDDGDAAYNPGATEDDCADPNDYNCDGSTGYADEDTDGWAACTECDDADPDVNPDAQEICNEIDDDCDGEIDEPDAANAASWYADDDGDGYGDADDEQIACDQPSGYVPDGGADSRDCDDADPEVNPAAEEVCDGIDDDCDGTIDPDDSADAATWYADSDGDGASDPDATAQSCEQPSGYLADDGGDCDDTDAAVNPSAEEVCDGIDNDCDGAVDPDDASDASTWYADADNDGYGDPGSTTTACEQPSDHLADSTDCDDADPDVNPAAGETCDSVDEDCDAAIDEGAADATTWYADTDNDGYGDADDAETDCDAPAGHVSDGADCDDTDAAVNPSAEEICNGLDDDCDGTIDPDGSADAATWYADADSDGFGDADATTTACADSSGEGPSDYLSDDSDCDDGEASVNPSAEEICDGIDNDCDGAVDPDDASDASTWYADADSDGYGDADDAQSACDQPSGYLADSTDCDDADAAVHPGASERCDFADDDCDAAIDEGLDDLDASGTADCKEIAVVSTAGFQSSGGGGSCDGLSYIDRELQEVEDQLAAMGLTAVFFYEDSASGIAHADLVYYPAVVYHNGGWSAAGPVATLDALESAAAAGQGLIFLGDDNYKHARNFDSGYGDARLYDMMWISAYSAGSSATVEVVDASHPAMDGAYGAVADFSFNADLDRGTALGSGETVLMQVSGSSSPVAIAAEDSGQRTLVMTLSLYNSHNCPISDTAGLGEIEVLFMNGMEWVLGW